MVSTNNCLGPNSHNCFKPLECILSPMGRYQYLNGWCTVGQHNLLIKALNKGITAVDIHELTFHIVIYRPQCERLLMSLKKCHYTSIIHKYNDIILFFTHIHTDTQRHTHTETHTDTHRHTHIEYLLSSQLENVVVSRHHLVNNHM